MEKENPGGDVSWAQQSFQQVPLAESAHRAQIIPTWLMQAPKPKTPLHCCGFSARGTDAGSYQHGFGAQRWLGGTCLVLSWRLPTQIHLYCFTLCPLAPTSTHPAHLCISCSAPPFPASGCQAFTKIHPFLHLPPPSPCQYFAGLFFFLTPLEGQKPALPPLFLPSQAVAGGTEEFFSAFSLKYCCCCAIAPDVLLRQQEMSFPLSALAVRTPQGLLVVKKGQPGDCKRPALRGEDGRSVPAAVRILVSTAR